ncbi:hypothetical protein J2P12_01655 [Candidatus Bathyarchaeota archaeon]|nr:hypothetical protein [Candidatus Bathyarchaeota archaeon]
MQTRHTVDLLEPKTWQHEDTRGVEGYLYYCILCEEALVLSKHQINPQKIQLVFDNACPGCGLELDRVLCCQTSILPPGRRLLTNIKCRDAETLLEHDVQPEQPARRASSLARDFRPSLTTGIDDIDRVLVLKKSQLVFLQGEPSNALSLLLCVRATLPTPEGLDTHIIFIDAGNLFDTYTISQHAINLGLDPDKVNGRIFLSRAFTHHQVYNLITDKLSTALEEYNSRLAIVSDITALFCDPDVRDKKESWDLFRESIRFLAKTAEKRDMIILVTNSQTRNKAMEAYLKRTAHVTANLKDNGGYTQLMVERHPFIPEQKQELAQDDRTITRYFQ